MDDEMREHLARHGFTPEGIEAVEKFEASARRRGRAAPAVADPLDFGDWDA